jgi:exosortase/archaeosortase family protein
VGIQDACTGVRSLAGTLMASIFFGEFYRLFWVKRVLLVGAGVLVAFLLNLVRTFTLGWVAASRGLEAIATWHDQTGFLIFCVAFAILWLMGSLLAGPLRQMPASAAPTELLRPVRLSVLIGTAIWLLLIAMSTEGWYQMKERNLARLRTWDVQLAETNRSLSFAEVPDEARAILRYSEGHSALFEEAGYPLWQIHFFRWAPGRSSSQLAVLHRPEICLPAAGLKFISGTRKAAIQFENVTIPFECSTFDSEGTPLYVFRTLCEDRRPLGSSSGFDQSISGRLHSAWEGRRNLGQKLLQIDISGASTEQAALADLQARLPQFLAVSK